MYREGQELFGRPMTARTDAQVDKVRKVLDSDRLPPPFFFLVSANEKGAKRTSVRLHRGGSSGDDKSPQQYSRNRLPAGFCFFLSL
jgi:hypothetical protein